MAGMGRRGIREGMDAGMLLWALSKSVRKSEEKDQEHFEG